MRKTVTDERIDANTISHKMPTVHKRGMVSWDMKQRAWLNRNVVFFEIVLFF
jgi:hypothetical protein